MFDLLQSSRRQIPAALAVGEVPPGVRQPLGVPRIASQDDDLKWGALGVDSGVRRGSRTLSTSDRQFVGRGAKIRESGYHPG